MEFQGFTPEAGAFLWELRFNNERPWFLAHKEEFERVLNRPRRALAAETLAEMEKRFPDYGFEMHISRIYRDARRLFGRGPYKDHLWFNTHTGSRHTQGPSYWFEIGAVTYSYGLGWWDADAEMMNALRRAIDANPARFERLVAGLDKGWQLWGTPYKRPKAERGEIINPWYNRRSLSVGWEYDLGGALFDGRLPILLADCYEKLLPLHDFFWAAWQAGRPEEAKA